MAGRTQQELYAAIDGELSWSESALPERERTKHVHRLHPYLGKFPPQLAEVLLRRRFAAGAVVYDPFMGSGTTLVEATVQGIHAVGCDVSAFNCLLAGVKSAPPDVEAARAELDRALALPPDPSGGTPWLREWIAPRGAGRAGRVPGSARGIGAARRAVGRAVASGPLRAAGAAPRAGRGADAGDGALPLYKHRRECRPVERAERFLRRYAADTVSRLAEYAALRCDVDATVLHADAREAPLPDGIDGVITSPPYPGLIDYHEQHRYAYELLGLDDRRELELGAAVRGVARPAIAAYCKGIAEVLAHTRRHLRPGANVAIVVNDSRDLYDAIVRRAGFRLETRTRRHVNRRTGRRAGEYFEDVLWLAPAAGGARAA